MKNFSELFEGGSKETQKKRKITFYCICVTLALIAALLVVLAILGVVSLVSQHTPEEPEQSAPQVSIGNTVSVTLGEDELHSGTLLILDGAHRYSGSFDAIIMRNADGRPKTQTGGNVYSILAARVEDDVDFRASPEATAAFNLMMQDFYAASNDDNVCVKKALTKANADNIDAVFSSGDTLALNYYFEYPGDDRSIYGVEKYSWIYTNAYKYGFINLPIDAPEDEESETAGSNIFRYVGVPHATYMKTKRLSFDAYLEQLRSATPDAPILVKSGKITYASYFIAKDGEHLVPADYNYTVSGNNIDGYIVTAEITKN